VFQTTLDFTNVKVFLKCCRRTDPLS